MQGQGLPPRKRPKGRWFKPQAQACFLKYFLFQMFPKSYPRWKKRPDVRGRPVCTRENPSPPVGDCPPGVRMVEDTDSSEGKAQRTV